MTSDLDIYRSAAVIVKQHGENTPTIHPWQGEGARLGATRPQNPHHLPIA